MHVSPQTVKYTCTYILLIFQPPDIIEQGKWLHALIKDTGSGSPRRKETDDVSDSDERKRNYFSDCCIFGSLIQKVPSFVVVQNQFTRLTM